MRKIQTQAEIDRKKKKNQLLVGGVMIALLVMSTLGYSLMSGDSDGGDKSRVNEAGVDFIRQNGIWMTEIDGNVFGFQNLPSEVSNINVNTSINLEEYSGQPLYFVNPNEGINEVLTNIGNYIMRYQESCLANETCDGDLPEKDCDSNLIIFEVGNNTEVYQDESCVFIVGDTLKATDAFLYKLLHIL